MPFADAAIIAGGAILGAVISSNAATSAAQTQANAANNAANETQSEFNTLNQENAPGRAAGYNALNTIGSLMPGSSTTYDKNGNPTGAQTGNGYFTQQFNNQDLNANLAPNYQFMLNQGLGTAAAQANASGGLIGGNALQGLNAYAQNYAQNAYQQAFNNFTTNQSNIYNRLASLAGIGQAAQSQQNQVGTALTSNITGLQTAGAASQAAGTVGSANAISSGLTGAGNSALLYSLLNNNSTGGSGNSGTPTDINAYAD